MSDSENIIAFMGVAGANADLACRKRYPYMQTMALSSFEEVFDAVEQGKAHYGLLPIENSQAGRVAEMHNLLPKSAIHLVAEHIEPVEHHLFAPKGAALSDIKEVYSHHQALMQCREFLRTHHMQTHIYSNTATAAKDVASWNDVSKAAICSALAGEIYQLERVAACINDAKDNATLFVTIAREPQEIEEQSEALLTSVLFTLRNIPSALYKSLGGFATNSINIIKLESYIKGGGNHAPSAQFFMTFEGNPHERRVQLALEELGFFTQKIRVLGVYPADPARMASANA